MFDVSRHGIDALAHKITPLSVPVLVRASADEVAEVLAELRSSDDVCLTDVPVSLLAHRIDAILHRSSRTHDGLTGLPTRSALRKRIAMYEHDGPLSMILMDVDHLKRLNDEHGHTAGDSLLRAIAMRIRRVAATAPDVALARVGGEEFAIVGELAADDAIALAERLRAAVAAAPFDIADPREAPRLVSATISAGCTTSSTNRPREELWRRADEAVYAAKRRGRDQVIHYDALERESEATSKPRELDYFEDVTRVITERVVEAITYRGRQLFEEIRTQADYDSLTGLYSRRFLDRRLPQQIDRAAETNTTVVVALLDLDFFGRVNKEHGWPTGDRVLSQVADRIMRCVRNDDWVARFGGEEILIVMHRTPLDEAVKVLERVRAAIADKPFIATGGQPISLTASIGADSHRRGERLEPLMERISQHLLNAKNGGRNRINVGSA